MKITVNTKEQNLKSGAISLLEVLKQNSVQRPEMVSVQLNGTFVKKDDFPDTVIKEGDVIDYLYFMGGGQ